MFAQIVFGQTSWFKKNTEWYYNNPVFQYGYPELKNANYLKTKVLGDTVIENKNCKILELRFCPKDSLYAHEYVYEYFDSVFYYNYYSKTFHLLYNFKAIKGDTIWVHKNQFKPTKGFFRATNLDSFGYVIDSTYSKKLSDGKDYIHQKITSLKPTIGDSWTYFCKEVIQYIGAKCNFWGTYSIYSDKNPGDIQLYKSDIRIDFGSQIDTTCSKPVISKIETQISTSRYEVFYSDLQVSIYFYYKPIEIVAFDILGKEIKFIQNDNMIIVNKNQFHSICLVKCLFKNNILSTIKIINQ